MAERRDPQPRQVTIGSIADKEAGRTDPELSAHQYLGWKLFTWVLIALGVGAALLCGYAIATYPDGQVIATAVTGLSATERVELLRELRADWHDQVRQTAQVVLIGPLITLLTAIVGYIIGRGESPS